MAVNLGQVGQTLDEPEGTDMSNTTMRAAERQRDRRFHWLVAGATFVAVAVLLGVAVWAAGRSSDGASGVPTVTNAMGMPVIEPTPGSPQGLARVDDVSASPQLWALGRVPLNVAVRPGWQISNGGKDTITLGDPHVQVNRGCCPGALTYDAATVLSPGAGVGLTFELSMHPGMDGPHDMTVHVPVHHPDGTDTTLELSVTGDFRS